LTQRSEEYISVWPKNLFEYSWFVSVETMNYKL